VLGEWLGVAVIRVLFGLESQFQGGSLRSVLCRKRRSGRSLSSPNRSRQVSPMNLAALGAVGKTKERSVPVEP